MPSEPALQADFRPLYMQVRDLLIARIGSGAWKPGQMIPSEFQLAAEYGVSQGTVRKALISLEQRKVVVRRQGRGTFVAQHTRQNALFHFFHIASLDGVKELPTSIILELRQKRATKEQAAALDLPPRAPVYALLRVRYLRGEPVILERIVLPAALYRDLDLPVGEEVPDELYVIYQRTYGVTVVRGDEQLAAVAADAADVRHLRVAEGAPLLEIVRVATTIQGTPVELRTSRVNTARHRYFTQVV